MGDLQNLHGKEAIEKLKDLVKDIKTCMFCTKLSNVPFDTRPMATQDIDENGNIWFLSSKNSNKNHDIMHNDDVQLIYADNSSAKYISIYGRAEVYTDKKKIEELWNPIAKAWFNEGKDDPDASVIKVAPKEGYYWDTKHNKMISFLKIVTGAVLGETMDDGIEGTLDV